MIKNSIQRQKIHIYKQLEKEEKYKTSKNYNSQNICEIILFNLLYY
jgi:hypothetical protein